jgi:hypothetical protein
VSLTRSAHSVQELRLLIAQLERRGLAASHPEARALLERSRALLRRQRPPPRRLAGKLATLLALAVDALLIAALPVLILLALGGGMTAPSVIFALFIPVWAAIRLRRHAAWLAEAARWLGYHLAWGWDWWAEAFSLRAMERLEARIQAREVMWGWRHYRRSLRRRPTLEDVAAFLALEYGPQAAREFRRAAEAVEEAQGWTLRGGTRRNRAAERLAALRWSALIALFGRLAASGALWPSLDAAVEAAEPAPSPQAPPLPSPAEPPERAARRADLREMIKRKRQDISAAFGWKLKSEAEIAQRDVHLGQLRADIALLERELAELGG